MNKQALAIKNDIKEIDNLICKLKIISNTDKSSITTRHMLMLQRKKSKKIYDLLLALSIKKVRKKNTK